MLLVIIANQASKMGSSLPKMRIKPGSEQQPPTDAELIATLTSGHDAASAGQEAVVATRRPQSGKPSGPRGIRQARVSDMVNLEVVGGHRLYDLYQNLFLAFAVAKQSGLCLAPLHTGRIPGTLYAPSFNGHNFTAVPLEAFADVASDKAPCRATALPPKTRRASRCVHSTPPARLATPTPPTGQPPLRPTAYEHSRALGGVRRE